MFIFQLPLHCNVPNQTVPLFSVARPILVERKVGHVVVSTDSRPTFQNFFTLFEKLFSHLPFRTPVSTDVSKAVFVLMRQMPDSRLDIFDENSFRPFVFNFDPTVDDVEFRIDLVMQDDAKWIVFRFQFNLKMTALDLVRSKH